MFSSRLNEFIFLCDLKPASISHFVASYIVKSKKIAVIEAGPSNSIPNLLSGLREIEVNVEDVDYVLISHIHLDHGGGAGRLLDSLPRAKLVVHSNGATHMENPRQLWRRSKRALGKIAEIYGEPLPVARDRIVATTEGMRFDLGHGVELTAIETLGHASHHQSFYEKKSRGIFVGDIAGIHLPGSHGAIPITPPPFCLEEALASLAKLKRSQPELLYYSHYGHAGAALERLQAHQTQLRLWASVVKEKLKDGADLVEIEREIVKRDSFVNQTHDYIKNHTILGRGIISQNIQGFMDHFRSKQERISL
jgi:glyoxylase-like metal-dependent hydrolase (beta-lactamase superfamily II)